MVAGFCLHDELLLMTRGGMSPAAALRTATINPARYLGLETTLGSVDVGKRGDLVLLDANPTGQHCECEPNSCRSDSRPVNR